MRRASIALAVLALVPSAVPEAGQIPTTFKNLQVLPKDIARPELIATMRSIAGELGVRCTHCHVGPDNLQGMDFATDEKQTKQVARTMLKMVRGINSEFVNTLPAANGGRQRVTCFTCHRRQSKPPRPLHEVLHAEVVARGVPAAIKLHEKLRAESMDAGLYDFREPALLMLAATLREQKRFDEALEILKVNATMFPQSAMTQMHLAETAMQKGDLALAESLYRRVLELEPGNAMALKALANITSRRLP